MMMMRKINMAEVVICKSSELAKFIMSTTNIIYFRNELFNSSHSNMFPLFSPIILRKDHLSGVKVLHGLDKVIEGGAVVMTLKDQSILADGDINEGNVL